MEETVVIVVISRGTIRRKSSSGGSVEHLREEDSSPASALPPDHGADLHKRREELCPNGHHSHHDPVHTLPPARTTSSFPLASCVECLPPSYVYLGLYEAK